MRKDNCPILRANLLDYSTSDIASCRAWMRQQDLQIVKDGNDHVGERFRQDYVEADCSVDEGCSGSLSFDELWEKKADIDPPNSSIPGPFYGRN